MTAINKHQRLFKPKHVQELLNLNFPPQRWLVEGLMPLGGITLLSGAPESYKTWVMLDVAVSVADGKPLFGKFPTTHTKVLIIDEESGERILQERLIALRASLTTPIYTESMKGAIFTAEYVNELTDWCIEQGVGLIIADSLSRIHKGDESTAKDMSALFSLVRQLTTAGISVVILHHNRKSSPGFSYSANDIRGSSDILASVDSAVALSTNRTGHVNVMQVKNRIASKERPFTIELLEDEEFRYFNCTAIGKSKDDEISERKDAIIELISASPEINQTAIYHYFANERTDFGGERAIKVALDELTKDGKLISSRGDKNALRFSINPSSVVL